MSLLEFDAAVKKALQLYSSPHYEINRSYVEFFIDREVSLRDLNALSAALETDRINFSLGSEGSPGYSSWTPGSDARPGYIQIFIEVNR